MRRGTTQNGTAEAIVRALTSGGVVARVNVRIDWKSGIAVGRVQTRGSWPTTTMTTMTATTMKMRVARAVLEWSAKTSIDQIYNKTLRDEWWRTTE